MPKIDEYSLTALPLTLVCGEAVLSYATGFFYKKGGQLYLVSNWHVFSGRNTYTGQSAHSDKMSIPDEVRLFIHQRTMPNFEEAKLPLFDEGKPTWFQHPKGQDVDVAALPVRVPDSLCAYELPRPSDQDMSLTVGSDVFVLGFPLGLAPHKVLPVWKRASVATEPVLDIYKLPMFWIDTATREGMSGAPVIHRTNRFASSIGHNVTDGYSSRFVGVYSGRYGVERDELSAQLGRVWHRSVIEEIVQAQISGTYELRGA